MSGLRANSGCHFAVTYNTNGLNYIGKKREKNEFKIARDITLSKVQ